MDFDQAIAVANATLQAHCDRPLSDLEVELLRGAWQQLTYEEIATASGYSLNYLQRDFGPRFWKLLSEAYGRKVSKVNARAVLLKGVGSEERGSGGVKGESTLTPHHPITPSPHNPTTPYPLPPTPPLHHPITPLASLPPDEPPRLVGRQAEWAMLLQWGTGLGQPGASDLTRPVLLLTGEPGIGKTCLLEAFCAVARSHQAQVLWGSSFAAEMMRPYGTWIDVLRSLPLTTSAGLPPELGFLLPELGQPAQALPDPSHLFDAVVQLLDGLARQAPLLLVLDDIQWLDEASSALLHYAIRVLRPLPVWVACTARSAELAANSAVAHVLRSLRREQRLQSLEIQPLDAAQIADLIDGSETHSPASAAQVFADSGGNPLLALEIARSRGQNQANSAHTLDALIGDRLEQLDEPTRELLPWLAALGRSFQPDTVARVADCSMGQLLAGIEQLEQQSIIRPRTALAVAGPQPTAGYDFAHGILRQVVYRQISPPRRQLIHRQIAQRLHHHTPDDETLASDIAYHAGLGGDPALAVAAAVMAAERSLKLFAYGEALQQAQQGLAHAQVLDRPAQILAQTQLLRVSALAGFSSESAAQLEIEAQQLMQAAKLLGLTDAEAGALEILLILQFEGNNYRKVHQHSLRAAEVGRLASPVTTARMLAYSGACLAEIGRDMARAEALLLEAQSLASRAGIEHCDIASGLGSVHRHCGRYDQARLHFQRAWRMAQTQRDHWRESTCLSYLAMTELESGALDAALPYCDEMAAVAENMPEDSSAAAIAQALAAVAHYQLETPTAAPELALAIAALEEADAKRMLAYVLMQVAEMDLRCDRGDLALSRAELALANAQIINHPSEIAQSWAIVVQGAIATGNIPRALTEFDALHQSIDLYELNLPAKTAVTLALEQIQPYRSQPNH
ncbi:ATP-binding protein [Nodosilinea sp. PGN35]|uniref:ATP-binding protein n=1 Tax=Nodosilinea sp. PGN35 TaxID=3020489 RepID=UPI0023B28D2C|nr:tetratricopeptide repeat protein [Nodosilinea sp. TSF1-S3]MDF0370062.1 AAA family ATPase [Nodosilinea sp. TSF1-S3]